MVKIINNNKMGNLCLSKYTIGVNTNVGIVNFVGYYEKINKKYNLVKIFLDFDMDEKYTWYINKEYDSKETLRMKIGELGSNLLYEEVGEKYKIKMK